MKWGIEKVRLLINVTDGRSSWSNVRSCQIIFMLKSFEGKKSFECKIFHKLAGNWSISDFNWKTNLQSIKEVNDLNWFMVVWQEALINSKVWNFIEGREAFSRELKKGQKNLFEQVWLNKSSCCEKLYWAYWHVNLFYEDWENMF